MDRQYKEKINITNEKANKEKNSDYEDIKKSMERTFDKYKRKNSKKDTLENEENKDDDNEEEPNKKSKRKITFVQRKKPTFQEFREKILRKNTKVSESTFY